MKINEILVKPILTEKATNMAKLKTYMFEVALNANKHQVEEALKQLYGVKIETVRMMIRKGKERRVGRRMQYKKGSDTKIAMVVIKEGKIDLFPQT